MVTFKGPGVFGGRSCTCFGGLTLPLFGLTVTSSAFFGGMVLCFGSNRAATPDFTGGGFCRCK